MTFSVVRLEVSREAEARGLDARRHLVESEARGVTQEESPLVRRAPLDDSQDRLDLTPLVDLNGPKVVVVDTRLDCRGIDAGAVVGDRHVRVLPEVEGELLAQGLHRTGRAKRREVLGKFCDRDLGPGHTVHLVDVPHLKDG